MESPSELLGLKQARKRRGTKRSKAGCLTCKVRKVKCDEAKPICARCVSFGIGCDGYDASTINSRAPVKAVVARRSQSSFQILPAPPRRWEFQSDMERLHLKEFQIHIAPELSGVFESAFWNHVVMQSTQESSFVRTVATALSAFGTAERISTSNEAIASRHRNFGLIQYQKGLQSMREELSHEPNARKALIGCLLICALEGIFGSSDTALTHARSGQKLVQEWLAAHPYQKKRQIGVNSPASHLIEDDLFQATSAFEHQKIGYFDSMKPEDHARIKRESTEAFENMPASFSDIEEARRYFYLASRRVRHFWMYRNGMIEKMQKVQKDAEDQTPIEINEDSEFCNKAEGSYAEEGADNQVGSVSVDRRPMVGQDMLGTIFDPFLGEEEQHVWEFVRWQFAFRDLYRFLKLSTDKRQVIAAHTLYIQCISCKVSCTVARDMSNTHVDQHLEDFREMLVVAKKIILLKKQTFRSRFNCELGINLILLMTAQLCRNRTLRREAVALLKLHDCREGIWDSIAMAKIGEHYIELEEMGAETEFIPEASRIRVLNLAFDQGKRAVTFYYSRGPTFTRDNLIKATVTW